MAVAALLESLDDVPEALKAEYKPVKVKTTNGEVDRFALDITGVDDHPSVKNLKAAHETTKTKLATANTEIATLKPKVEGLPEDFTVDEFNRIKALADKNVKPEEHLAQLRAQLEKKHGDEKKALETRIATLETSLRKMVVDEQLTKSLIDAGVSKEFVAAAKAMLKERGNIKIEEKDGNFIAAVETDMGPMEIPKFVAEWSEGPEGKPFVKPAAGGGADGGKGGVKTGRNPWGKDTWNLTEQSALITENPEKARQLCQAAGKTPNW